MFYNLIVDLNHFPDITNLTIVHMVYLLNNGEAFIEEEGHIMYTILSHLLHYFKDELDQDVCHQTSVQSVKDFFVGNMVNTSFAEIQLWGESRTIPWVWLCHYRGLAVSPTWDTKSSWLSICLQRNVCKCNWSQTNGRCATQWGCFPQWSCRCYWSKWGSGRMSVWNAGDMGTIPVSVPTLFAIKVMWLEPMTDPTLLRPSSGCWVSRGGSPMALRKHI